MAKKDTIDSSDLATSEPSTRGGEKNQGAMGNAPAGNKSSNPPSKKQTREEKLAAALRENLRRRKQPL